MWKNVNPALFWGRRKKETRLLKKKNLLRFDF